MLKMAWDRRDEYVFHAPPLAESVARAKALGLANPGAPVLLIDHCDNCGSGGAQDVMDVVAEILSRSSTTSPSRRSAIPPRWRR